MNTTDSAVRQQSKLYNLLLSLFFIIALFTTELSHADKLQKKNTETYRVSIIYSQENSLQKEIQNILSNLLFSKFSNIKITTFSAHENKLIRAEKPDLSISIGALSIQSAEENQKNINKLFIATDPESFKLTINSNTKDAVLYMTQSYCKQLQLINSLNMEWKTVSLLVNDKKPVNSNTMESCALKNNLNIYKENTSGSKYLKSNIKNALNNSDVLLALPNKDIYNSKTVKNILLTSYRYRIPVIAFSKSFADAGALASIYSNKDSIAKSASNIVFRYFENNQNFNKSINHPKTYDIRINKQVFRALGLPTPNIENLKQYLDHLEQKQPGEQL